MKKGEYYNANKKYIMFNRLLKSYCCIMDVLSQENNNNNIISKVIGCKVFSIDIMNEEKLLFIIFALYT